MKIIQSQFISTVKMHVKITTICSKNAKINAQKQFSKQVETTKRSEHERRKMI